MDVLQQKEDRERQNSNEQSPIPAQKIHLSILSCLFYQNQHKLQSIHNALYTYDKALTCTQALYSVYTTYWCLYI